MNKEAPIGFELSMEALVEALNHADLKTVKDQYFGIGERETDNLKAERVTVFTSENFDNLVKSVHDNTEVDYHTVQGLVDIAFNQATYFKSIGDELETQKRIHWYVTAMYELINHMTDIQQLEEVMGNMRQDMQRMTADTAAHYADFDLIRKHVSVRKGQLSAGGK